MLREISSFLNIRINFRESFAIQKVFFYTDVSEALQILAPKRLFLPVAPLYYRARNTLHSFAVQKITQTLSSHLRYSYFISIRICILLMYLLGG